MPSQFPSPPPTPERRHATLSRLAVGLLIAACAGPLSINLVDPDLWGHVRYGQDWLAEGRLPRQATHTYTAVGHPWINHENLAELLLTRGYETIGSSGLLVVKFLLGLAVLGAMALTARRRRVAPIVAWGVFLLVATNLNAFWLLRPQLLSFVWFAAMLFCLERATAHWGARKADLRHNRRKSDRSPIDWRWLAALPWLMLLWANSHGGFLAGLAVLCVFLAGRAVELLLRGGDGARRRQLGLLAIGVACVLVTFINPYGPGLHAWLMNSLGEPRPEITEWRAPTPDTPVFWPFVALAAVAAVSLLLSKRPKDPVRIAILLLVGWQAAEHLRHIAFFAILCGFWVPPHLQSALGRLRGRAGDRLAAPLQLSRRVRRTVAVSLVAATVLLAAGAARRLATLPVEKSLYPVDAIHWMADHRVEGKLVVCFNWAQYAIAALAPEVRVSFDGRFRTCYPQEVVDMNFDFLLGDRGPRSRSPRSGPIDGTLVLRHGVPDYVLVDRNYRGAVGVMLDQLREENPEWSLVYQDGVAQVWGRRSVVDAEDSRRRIPADSRSIGDRVSSAEVEWPALPRQRRNPPRDDAPPGVARSAQPVARPTGVSL